MAIPGTTLGGTKTRAFIANARAAQNDAVETIEIGFYQEARYPPVHTGRRGGRRRSPVPVTNVAAWQEFGTDTGIPERPFMRTAARDANEDLVPILRSEVDPSSMIVTRRTAGRLGEAMKSRIQRFITNWTDPENAERTRKQKGSSKPLIDTGLLRSSTTYKIDP